MLFPTDARGGYCYASLVNGRCANQNSQLLTKMQCCCDSGRCWSDGSTPEMCPIRGTGGVTYIACNFLLLSISPCLNKQLTLLHILILEEHQKLCIQMPDTPGGRVPGGPELPGIYPVPFPGLTPGQGPGVIPGQIPIQGPGHVPGQPQIPYPGPFPGQLPIQPPPPGVQQFSFSSICFTCLHFHTGRLLK